MPNYITTHDTNGKSVFSNKVSADSIELSLGKSTLEIISTNHSFPANVSTEADIDQYSHDRQHGLSPNFICPPNGTAAAIISMEPNAELPMHRTLTLDVCCVLQGELELHLDSGEKQTLKAGDTIVQRATMHKWYNVSPNDGWAKVFASGQPIREPLEVAGKQFGFEWLQ